MEGLLREMEVVAGLTKKCIEENSSTAQDQSEYAARYNAYADRHERAKEQYDLLSIQKCEKRRNAKAINRFIDILLAREELLTEFDNRLWLTVVNHVTVHRDGKMIFRFSTERR